MPAKDQYDEKARDICPFTHPLHRLEPECEGCLGISTALRCAHAAGKAEGREEAFEEAADIINDKGYLSTGELRGVMREKAAALRRLTGKGEGA
jgi:hypothetical protein